MSRRLVNRSGTTVASSSRAATTMPDYQPPSCPLNETARRALGDLSNNRGTVEYQMHLKDSVRLVGSSVGDLHERLREQRERLAGLRARREEKGIEKTSEEELLEAHVVDFEKQVHSLTDKSEKAIRDLIDRRVELEDESKILGDLYTVAASNTSHADLDPPQRSTRRAGDVKSQPEEDDEGEAKPLTSFPSVIDVLNKQRLEKATDYSALSMQQRYALNNDYAAFKKLWHDAMAGEDGPPLPDASRWFRPDGQPVMRELADDDAGEDDDDIAVAREVLSMKCPLTLQPMKQPYSNRKCKHTFEKAAILDYLSMRGEKQCPQTGCSQMFSRAQFDEDFYLDQAMVRRIRRARQAEEQNRLDEDDDDEEAEDDDEVMVRGQKTVSVRSYKREKVER
ncbi:zinc-finger of the MIZ type in Nse subunit-domain-containing protein [Dactylonectria estremocensis]|uniref:Zinc-finger of the MIZ type in Nse subunit-domain-containing protein n=1 Tax=Dactylonectria estremocensis TaxID=1079267 RepID=A0A9P9FBL6_9HYPO|nr:zinc-finger of the MIZ type in Nse subunit-domain-containing protein [Dactylonectria estremocensis]